MLRGTLLMLVMLTTSMVAKSVIIEWPFFTKTTSYGTRIERKLDGEQAFIRFKGSVPYHVGDQVRVVGQLRHCRPARNPGMFDECRWWHRQGITAQLDVSAHQLREKTSQLAIVRWLSQVPSRLYQRIERLFPDHAGMVYTMIFGSRIDGVASQTKQHFLGVGLIHLLVVSGAQVGLVSMAIIQLSRMLWLPPRVMIILLMLAQLFYCMIAGVDASILRSVVMINAWVFIRFILLRGCPVLAPLLVAALVLIIVMPLSVLSPGFWYSFFITFGLIMVAPKALAQFGSPHVLHRYVVVTGVAVLCAQPIQIIQGQPFQPFGLVANAWVSWCGSVILLGGLVTIIFGDLFPDALLGVVVNGLSAVVSTMQHVAAQLEVTPFPIPYPFHWLIGCGLMLLILAMVWPRLRALVMIQVTIVFLLSLIHLSQRCKVIAIDVDQGDATLVIDGFKSVLVDTGGIRLGGAYAKTHIYPVLNYYGIRQLDVLVLTHWDLDHVGGLPEIMARGVKHVISPVRPVPGHAVVHDKPQSISLPSGDIMLTPVSRFLHDPKSNHQALLVSIQLNDWSFLITGDIDQYAESLLIRLGQIHSHDVLKLGHHGSQYSTSMDLLHHVQPQFAWNSAGVHNRYGHPHASVLSRLSHRGIPWMSTHLTGAIEFNIGSDIMVSSKLEKKEFRLRR